MAALNPVRNAVFRALHDLVKERLSEQHRSDWLNAYTYSGRGSAMLRSGEIRRICEDSAPPISSAMKPSAHAFLAEVIGIVKNGVEKSGGTFTKSRAVRKGSPGSPTGLDNLNQPGDLRVVDAVDFG